MFASLVPTLISLETKTRQVKSCFQGVCKVSYLRDATSCITGIRRHFASGNLPQVDYTPVPASKYSEDLIDGIFQSIAEGMPVRGACKEAKITAFTLFNWLDSKPGLSDRYARAKELAMEKMADEILTIGDNNTRDEKFITDYNGKVIPVADNDYIQRSKLRVDTRKWLMSKLAPKKYGDKVQQQITGADGKDLPISLVIGEKKVSK